MVTVIVEVPDVICDGLKVAVAPAGNPEALNDTALLNPFTGVTVAE